MDFPDLLPAEFILRDTRFTAGVRVAGEVSQAHIANTGRLPGLLMPGGKVWLSRSENPGRKTRYDLKLVEAEGVLVSVDTRLPNLLYEEYIGKQQPGESTSLEVQREVRLGKSRIDLRLTGPDGICWVETKSVTLVQDRVARFPDAPTSRGRRHLLELAKALEMGQRARVVFVIQRPDADLFAPHLSIDPEFATIVAGVAEKGVEVQVFICEVSLGSIRIANEIECKLDATSEKIHV